MKKTNILPIIKSFTLVILMAALSGCSDYLDNPLKDRETGEDINLLVIDFNFFNTRISVKLTDAKDGSLISVPATIKFTGDNGNDIVTFTGEKKPQFSTTQGQLEVTVDPNVSITAESPLKFAVIVEAEGYNTVSKGFQFQNEGNKSIELKLAKTSDQEDSDLGGDVDLSDGDTTIVFFAPETSGLKSATAEETSYQINYNISWNDLLKFKDTEGNLLFSSSAEAWEAYNSDPENFIKMSLSKFTGYDPETNVVDIDGEPETVLFQKLETGNLTKLVVDGREVGDLNGGVIGSTSTYNGLPVPDLFGFAEFITDRWKITGTDTVYSTLHFSYTLVKASTETLCATGSSITFRSVAKSSFSIDADVYDMENNLLTTVNFKGNFPETITVENTPQKAVKLVFRNNNPAFQPIAPLEIADFCTGDYLVNVQPTEGYKEYQIVLKAFCPDNPAIAIAPTYSGEYKIKGSDYPWQGAVMTGGVVDLLGLPNQEYQYRLLWENEWEYSDLVTEFDEAGNYLHPSGSKIYSELMDDGRIRIYVEHHFSQNVCDDLGW
jgi:hypothetical protein